MFTIIIDGVQRHERAGNRTPEELQHHLTHVDGHSNVRVFEWIKRGAKTPLRDTPDDI